MKRLNKIIYLNFAGFNLKVSFIPSGKKTINFLSYDGLDDKIKILLGGFIEPHTPKSISYSIDIHEQIPIFRKYSLNNTCQNYILFSEDGEKKIKTFQHISFSQFMNLLLIILHKLLVQNKGFLLHAASNNVQGDALIYTGPSGVGKSTAMTLLHGKYPSLADDSVIIKKEENNFYLYQTPFIEKNDWVKKTKGRFKIGRIFFLRKSSDFSVKKITNKNFIITHLTKQLWTDKIALQQQMKYFLDFIQNFDEFYFLHFAKDKKLVDFIRSLYLW